MSSFIFSHVGLFIGEEEQQMHCMSLSVCFVLFWFNLVWDLVFIFTIRYFPGNLKRRAIYRNKQANKRERNKIICKICCCCCCCYFKRQQEKSTYKKKKIDNDNAKVDRWVGGRSDCEDKKHTFLVALRLNWIEFATFVELMMMMMMVILSLLAYDLRIFGIKYSVDLYDIWHSI